MNQVSFNRAMSYIDDDIVASFFENKSKREHMAASLPKTRAFWKWSAVAAVFCLVVATSLAMLLQFEKGNTNLPVTSSTAVESNTDAPFTLPAAIEDIVWREENVMSPESAPTVNWNGIDLSNELYETLDKITSDQYMAINIAYQNSEDLNRYIFGGKSYLDHRVELDSLRDLANRYDLLRKDGEYLKFGERVYTEGLEDGTRWTKEHYDERVAFFGTDILSSFIVDGVFLSEQLKEAITQNQNLITEKENILADLRQSYHESTVPMIADAFDQYAVTVKHGGVYLFITKAELETLRVENREDFYLSLASRNVYEGVNAPVQTPVITVAKDTELRPGEPTEPAFDCSKIRFESLGISGGGVPDSDEDVVSMLNQAIELLKYGDNYLEFTFFYKGELTEEDFKDMQYKSIYQDTCMPRIAMQVEFDSINLEALKVLSNRSEITTILITGPLIPSPDGE